MSDNVHPLGPPMDAAGNPVPQHQWVPPPQQQQQQQQQQQPMTYGAAPGQQALPSPSLTQSPLMQHQQHFEAQQLQMPVPPQQAGGAVATSDYPAPMLESPPNLTPPGATAYQLEVPDTDGRVYGRNWCWLSPDCVGVGAMLYNTPNIFRRIWNAILSVLVMLRLRAGPPPSSKVDFASWSSVHSQTVQSIFLSRVDYIGLDYVVAESSKLKWHVAALRPQNRMGGMIQSLKNMLDEVLAWWGKLALSVCLLLSAIGIILCFFAQGADGSPKAMTGALVVAVLLLVLALCGLAWGWAEKNQEAESQFHASVERPSLRMIMIAWAVLCACALLAMICAAVFVGDWKANGPDRLEEENIKMDWSKGDKFVCKNWDRGDKVFKAFEPDIPDHDSDPGEVATMCSDLERGTSITCMLFFIGCFITSLVLLWLVMKPRSARKYLYAHVTFHGKASHGLPATVLLEAPAAQAIQHQFMAMNQGRYAKEVAYIYAPTLSQPESKFKTA